MNENSKKQAARELKVKDLIALLQKADPEATVLGEFEGGIFAIEPNEVRVGTMHKVFYSTGSGYFYSHGEPDPNNRLDVRRPQGTAPPTCFEGPAEKGVLLWAGESESQWPNRLDGEPTDEKY